MSEQGWRAFVAADGLEDWDVLHGGATAVFRTGSLAEAARLATAIAEVEGFEGSGALLHWTFLSISRGPLPQEPASSRLTHDSDTRDTSGPPEGLMRGSTRAPAPSPDSGFKTWGRRVGYTLLAVLVLIPMPIIAWGRAQRSSSAPAALEEIWPLSNGRVTIGAFSFTVNGHVYRGQDEDRPTPGRGSRTWSRDETRGMHVCYDPARPGEEFALAPARYHCGDFDMWTTDGGW